MLFGKGDKPTVMATNPIKVLIIEDNPVHASVLKYSLSESTAPLFVVRTAEKLSDGLQQLTDSGDESIDVVLLDLVLPDSEDLETFLRVHTKAPHVPIVILTNVDDIHVAKRAVELGAQDYLLKTEVQQASLRKSIEHSIERMRARNHE